MSLRPPAQPDRSRFSGSALAAYDAVVDREIHRKEGLDPASIGGYYGGMLQSPEMCHHINELGRLVRRAGNHDDTFTHADREWVDQVLCWDWRTNAVMRGHLEDALVRGVRPEAIRALRTGRENELDDAERQLTVYIRQVRDGRVTDEAYAAMVDRMGEKGTVEYTIFIMFLVLTIRLIEAFTGATGPSDEELMEEINGYCDGTRPLPSKPVVGSG